MNVELEIQEGIYEELAELLGKATSMEKASGYFHHYFQGKLHEGVIDIYDYTLQDNGQEGISANVEFSFAWNINNVCAMMILPKDNPGKAYERAMAIV